MEHEPHRIHRIVGHAKRLHGDIPDEKIAPGGKDPPILWDFRRLAPKRLGRQAVTVDGRVELLGPDIKTAGVIAVFVSQEDPIHLERVDPASRQALPDLQATEATINQQAGLGRLDQRAVSSAPATEDGEKKHSGDG